MLKSELIKKSPLRVLDTSEHGGVGKGNIGIIAARKGVGKTACLVHIATDQLLQGNHVIHVSFTERPDHIISWYEDIFTEIARRRSLEHAMEVHDEIVRNRIIMNFTPGRLSIQQILDRIGTMIQKADFNADCIAVDGYDFYSGSKEDFETIKAFAKDNGLRFWFSASLRDTVKAPANEKLPAVLAGYESKAEVIILLEPEEKRIRLNLVKDHRRSPGDDLHLSLDPKTLLISDEE
ncbi:MAG: hypothetical protein JW881_08190 [Spirochaetales bacterium]|nr:hypothetical protein [Spirochaetales bacterium]